MSRGNRRGERGLVRLLSHRGPIAARAVVPSCERVCSRPMTSQEPTAEHPQGQEGQPPATPGISLVPEPTAGDEVRAQLEEFDVGEAVVGIVMGSESDMEQMQKAADELDKRGIANEVNVMSAHRQPDLVAEYAKSARARGLRVIIAGAGISAALPGAVAAHTEVPVIGVPLSGRLSAAGGLDAILSIVQMPPGVPVACVGLDNARNAAVLAARILGA